MKPSRLTLTDNFAEYGIVTYAGDDPDGDPWRWPSWNTPASPDSPLSPRCGREVRC